MSAPKKRRTSDGFHGATIPERHTAAVRSLRYRVTKDGRLLAGTTDEAKAHSLAQLLGGVVETGRRAP